MHGVGGYAARRLASGGKLLVIGRPAERLSEDVGRRPTVQRGAPAARPPRPSLGPAELNAYSCSGAGDSSDFSLLLIFS